MYRDLRTGYWWPGMKRDVARYVESCLTCLKVKAEHQKPHGKMQPLEIPEWKWENLTMDLITKLPKTPRKFDAIWVIVDRLTKSAIFLPIRWSSTVEQLAKIYVDEVVSRHGVPVSIISDRDVRFTSRFWERFHSELGTRLHFSTAYHPQTDGQSERTIQTLEDMLRACVLDFGGSWDTYLPLAVFSYNNSYHSSIGMPLFEMLYGRRCRTPICWGEVGQRVLGSTEVVQRTTEDTQKIRERLRTAQSRQKSYADRRRSNLEFQVGDRVLLKVSPWKGVIRFRKRGKLGPRYIGPFTVLARVGKLRKCLADETAHIPLDDIQVDESLNYVERPGSGDRPEGEEVAEQGDRDREGAVAASEGFRVDLGAEGRDAGALPGAVLRLISGTKSLYEFRCGQGQGSGLKVPALGMAFRSDCNLGEAAYILGIKIYRNRSKRLIGLSQSTYIDKILKKFRMDESKKGFIPMQHGIVLSKTQCPVSSQDQDKMKSVPYASAIGSIMYAMLCTRPDVAYSVSVTSRYQQNPGEPHWVAVKNILKYLRRTKEMFLVFGGSEDEISVTGYSDASFQTDRDDFRSQSGYVFTLNGGAISWKSSKQDTIADSTTEAEYIAASDAAKEAVRLRNFLSDLRVIASISRPLDIFCDNSGAVAQAKEPREHHKSRHVLRKYHLIREIIGRGDVRICKIPTEENVADPLTKPLARVKHEAHASSIGMQYLDASS
ncbi:hypothetical protein OSB04_024672 [Centaurea solstitialis]|uniref:Integrase catalytic domain-containing protein n=1 Tax=Centaurea solstitialis TaxID=347529 RepID=A0AA38SLJ9_9ASTR|nr:hypothetical protein OSB04_024672 [Centaurea solstitialis]